MDTVPGLKSLRERKRELLLESAMNRQALRLQAGELRYHAGRAQSGVTAARSVWKWAAMAGGIFAAKRATQATSFVGRAASVVTAATMAWKAWKAHRSGRDGSFPDSGPTSG